MKPPETNPLIGKWAIVKIMSFDQYNVPPEEINKCMGKQIIFYKDSIINKSDCLLGESCYHPNYIFKKVNAKIFFDNDTDYISDIGVHSDSITIVTDSCDALYLTQITFISNDTICMSGDDRAFIFARGNR